MGLWGRMCHGGIVYITVICDLIGKKNRTFCRHARELLTELVGRTRVVVCRVCPVPLPVIVVGVHTPVTAGTHRKSTVYNNSRVGVPFGFLPLPPLLCRVL